MIKRITILIICLLLVAASAHAIVVGFSGPPADGGGETYIWMEDFEGTGTPTGWTVTDGTPNFDYTTSPAPLEGTESLHYNSGGNPLRFYTDSIGDSGDAYVTTIAHVITSTAGHEFQLRDTSNNLLATIIRGGATNSLIIDVEGGSADNTAENSWPISTTVHIKIYYEPSDGSSNAVARAWVSTDGTTWGTAAESTNAGSPTASLDNLYWTCNYVNSEVIYDDIRVSDNDIDY